ncbi:zinc ribbon domain-containing protein [candidate division KSB1 bacterium]|nr:zinc ribbon domain-containing protein [candidate division KSB1 bacterium]
MPIYEYLCETCETKFEELVPDSQASTARCPKCGTREVQRLLSLFATNNAASSSYSPPKSSGHACGCGSCSCGSH